MAQSPDDLPAPLTADSDKGGRAPALKNCPHLKDSSFQVPNDLSVFREFKEISCDANNCDKKECWICCKCYKILCGRYANKHMLEHYKTETNGDHCIAMSMGDSEFWCFKCLILKIPLNEIPDEVKDDVMGAYLDDGAIAPVYEFYEQAHLAHWGELPPTSKKKNDTGQEKKEMADIAEEINTEFNEKEDSLAKVPNLSANKISVPKDENLNKVGIFYHEAMTLHKCEDHDHVERPGRISVSYENLKYYGLLDKCKEYKCNEIDPKLIKYTHPKKHIEKILRGYDPTKKKSKPKDLDPGQLAVGGFYESLEKVCIAEEINSAFALVRPPGHHACEQRAMGFCHFNNVVVGINALKEQYKDDPKCPKKILIVDWDVHHGNGTQDLTYEDASILYFSIHRYSSGIFGFYPGTGAIEDTGFNAKKKKKSKGKNSETEKNNDKESLEETKYDESNPLGKNVNVTMRRGMGDYEYLLVWRDILIPIAQEFAPDLIIVSAGFDACTGDPLGGLRVTPPCYGELTKQLLQVQSKMVILLEGGYNLDSMPKAVCCCVHALLTVNEANYNNNSSNDASDEKENENVVNNDKNGLEHSCMTGLLDIVSESHWKKKMNAGFELSDEKRDVWSSNELLVIERSFGYLDGCLECINKWSENTKENKMVSIEFHKEWMKHYWSISGMWGNHTYYSTQYPESRQIDFTIEAVLDAQLPFWPNMKEMKKKYETITDAGFAQEMMRRLKIGTD